MGVRYFNAKQVTGAFLRPQGYRFPVGLTILSSGPTSVDYLVIAGGAGGGGGYPTITTGGGGGAGGFRTASGFSISQGTPYSITIGGGGSGDPNGGGGGRNGTVGTASIFSTITSAGGGYGAWNQQAGGNGGSGGGASGPVTPGSFPGGLGNTPATSPSQGNTEDPQANFLDPAVVVLVQQQPLDQAVLV